ncbi:MAG: hypothetical protein HND40_09820 [Ignavibacteriota bacterium]|jgi:cell division protein FtsL|nr:MAG: hypothetical protein F9K42_09440 [Ignavibacterium sp.]MBL1153890.1 hypothetical protein [Ignavibacteriota bacterium]MCO6447439.1 hypothetical protein [Ignavibacterium album]MCZ2269252.1 hypothetical protein [Ignavibacteriales bacterium]MDX9711146.1 hypothetical protein [Ignavibacteriaceae bacterium]
MKKSSKPTLLLVLSLLLIVTVFALLNVGVKLKYEQKLLLKDKAEKTIKAENQKRIKLTAEYQTVTAEERIVNTAKSELGMIRNAGNTVIINVDRKKLEENQETLAQKYEQ